MRSIVLRTCDLSLAVRLEAGVLSLIGEQVGALEKLTVRITAEGREGGREEGSGREEGKGRGGEGREGREGREGGEGGRERRGGTGGREGRD